MADHQTRVRPRRRGGVHRQLRGAGVPDRHRARAGRSRRNLVVLYLSGGNDALSTLIPYTDPLYYAAGRRSRSRPANVLQIGTDRAGNALGLHPRLTGLRTIFNAGRLAIIQRTGYPNSSRSHFQGTDIWSTADPRVAAGHRLARALSRHAAVAGRSADRLVHRRARRRGRCSSRTVGVPAIPSVARLRVREPERRRRSAVRARRARRASRRTCRSISRTSRSSTRTAQAAFATLDRVAQVGTYAPTVTYPNNGFAQALRTVAGAMVEGHRHEASSGCRPAGTTRTPAQNTEPGQRLVHEPDDDAQRRAVRVLHATCRTRDCSATRWCCSSRSSAAASPRTAARAPTTAPPA